MFSLQCKISILNLIGNYCFLSFDLLQAGWKLQCEREVSILAFPLSPFTLSPYHEASVCPRIRDWTRAGRRCVRARSPTVINCLMKHFHCFCRHLHWECLPYKFLVIWIIHLFWLGILPLTRRIYLHPLFFFFKE